MTFSNLYIKGCWFDVKRYVRRFLDWLLTKKWFLKFHLKYDNRTFYQTEKLRGGTTPIAYDVQNLTTTKGRRVGC